MNKNEKTNYLRQSKGITLIALIVTIIVLIILAGISINLILGENGIIKKATEAEEEIIIAEEKEQIEMAYSSAMIESIGEGITEEALRNELNKLIGDDTKIIVTTNLSDNTLNVLFKETQHNYSISKGKVLQEEYKGLTITSQTEGVVFTDKDGNIKNATDKLSDGDIVKYGDYEYRYNMLYDWYGDCDWKYFRDLDSDYYEGDEPITGWGSYVIENDKESYGDLCGNIYGVEVKHISFGNCEKLISSPKLPNTIVNMFGTYYECYKLKNAPEIPNSVITMYSTFGYCESLTEVTKIPNSVTIMEQVFYECISLVNAPEIPNSVRSLNMTFYGCTSLINVPVIPNSVIDMGSTFCGCTNLVNVPEIPNSVTDLRRTFMNCRNLETIINIPASVTEISSLTFYNCSKLEGILVHKSNTIYDSRDNCNAVIETSSNKLISGCENTVIPDGVTRIEEYAFLGCLGLIEITIPDSVTSIANYAFEGCTGLTEITIPDSVTSIGWEVFRNCSSLGKISVDENNKVYDSRENCNAIIKTDTNQLICGCKNTVIPSSVTTIGYRAFSGCTGLEEITISKNVTYIYSDAFIGCTNLTKITLEEGSTLTVPDNKWGATNAVVE